MPNKYPIIKDFKENNKYYYLIETPYGICKQDKCHYNIGKEVSIRTALNKSEYFRKLCYEKFGENNDDLSEINYISHNALIKIISKNFGIYYITPTKYLATGKKKRTYNKEHYTKDKKLKESNYCTLSNWKKSSQKSKNLTSYKLYFIKCWDENESFYKIGITFVKISDRFNCFRRMPYKYKIIKVIKSSSCEKIYNLEKKYHLQHKIFKYIPKKDFHGKHECFSNIYIRKKLI